jgi:hypothetical protein
MGRPLSYYWIERRFRQPFDWDKIDNGDDDVEYTSSESTDTWYVNAFVVAIGMDENYRRLYSEAKFLGRSFIEDID